MKRITTVLLVFLLCLALSVPCLAARPGSGGDTGPAILCSIVLGVVIALVVSLCIKASMKSAVEKREASGYIPQGGAAITHRSDHYTHTTTTRIHSPQSKPSDKD